MFLRINSDGAAVSVVSDEEKSQSISSVKEALNEKEAIPTGLMPLSFRPATASIHLTDWSLPGKVDKDKVQRHVAKLNDERQKKSSTLSLGDPSDQYATNLKEKWMCKAPASLDPKQYLRNQMKDREDDLNETMKEKQKLRNDLLIPDEEDVYSTVMGKKNPKQIELESESEPDDSDISEDDVDDSC